MSKKGRLFALLGMVAVVLLVAGIRSTWAVNPSSNYAHEFTATSINTSGTQSATSSAQTVPKFTDQLSASTASGQATTVTVLPGTIFAYGSCAATPTNAGDSSVIWRSVVQRHIDVTNAMLSTTFPTLYSRAGPLGIHVTAAIYGENKVGISLTPASVLTNIMLTQFATPGLQTEHTAGLYALGASMPRTSGSVGPVLDLQPVHPETASVLNLPLQDPGLRAMWAGDTNSTRYGLPGTFIINGTTLGFDTITAGHVLAATAINPSIVSASSLHDGPGTVQPTDESKTCANTSGGGALSQSILAGSAALSSTVRLAPMMARSEGAGQIAGLTPLILPITQSDAIPANPRVMTMVTKPFLTRPANGGSMGRIQLGANIFSTIAGNADLSNLPHATGLTATTSPIGTTDLATALNAASGGLTGIVTLPNTRSASTTVNIGGAGGIPLPGATPFSPTVLSRGCNCVVVTSAIGTSISNITALVSPANAMASIWRFSSSNKLSNAGFFSDPNTPTDFTLTGNLSGTAAAHSSNVFSNGST